MGDLEYVVPFSTELYNRLYAIFKEDLIMYLPPHFSYIDYVVLAPNIIQVYLENGDTWLVDYGEESRIRIVVPEYIVELFGLLDSVENISRNKFYRKKKEGET